MLNGASCEAPRDSDCIQMAVRGHVVLLVLTRTVPQQAGTRRWLVSVDSEVAGAISEQPGRWWGVEPGTATHPTSRCHTWQQAAKTVAESTAPASDKPAQKPASRPAAASSCRPRLSLVWSATN